MSGIHARTTPSVRRAALRQFVSLKCPVDVNERLLAEFKRMLPDMLNAVQQDKPLPEEATTLVRAMLAARKSKPGDFLA